MATKGNNRFEGLRTTGEGYETEGRENFDHKVEFIFDYSNLNNTTRIVRKELGDFSYELYKTLKPVKTDKASGFVFIDGIKGNTNSVNGKISKMIKMVPDPEVLGDDMLQLAKGIAAESKSTMKKYIGSRVQTGRMKASVYGRVKRQKNKLVIQAGWLDLWYKYFGFQEEGTSKIRPMHAVMRTYLEMAPWVQKGISQYFRNYTRSGWYKR
jgi:hypothetical protein